MGLRRYALAVFAPSSVSAAHLVTQLVLLSHLPAGEFGLFAFLMVLVQFGFGISNALVCTPYIVNIGREPATDSVKATFFTANLVFSVLFGIAVYFSGRTIESGAWLYIYAGFAALAMLRWFGRAHNYAELRPTAAAISDLVYSVSLIGFIVLLSLTDLISMPMVSAAFLLATLLSCLCLGGSFLKTLLSAPRVASLPAYGAIWRDQSRWTLLGVVTTEATANVHSYFVTFIAGPAAFAPISAGALFVRPVLLAMSSLTQLEAPVLVRAIANHAFQSAEATRRRFHLMLFCLWIGTGLLAWAIVTFYPTLIIKPTLSGRDVITALVFFMAICLAQIWQTPNSALLQAAGRFEALSRVSVASCIFSIAGVLLSLFLLPPVYSLIGIAVGQFAMAVLTARLVGQWTRSRHAGAE